MLTFFSNPLLCLKQGNFKITQTDERKGSKNYIKVNLVLKLASCLEVLTIIGYQPKFLLLNFYCLLYCPEQTISSKKVFYISPGVYAIWCVLTFCKSSNSISSYGVSKMCAPSGLQSAFSSCVPP